MHLNDFCINSVNIFGDVFKKSAFEIKTKKHITKSRFLTTETHITKSVISVYFRKNVMRYAFCRFHNNNFYV